MELEVMPKAHKRSQPTRWNG